MNKVRVALLGCGWFMGEHAHRLRAHPNAQIVALCDTNQQQTERLLRDYLAQVTPAPEIFTDQAAMHARAKPDAVFIATPPVHHFQNAVTALEAGCHVFVEKPMVTNVRDACALEAKATQTGRILVVGYNTPCTAPFGYLRQAIRDKTFGRLEVVNGYLAHTWMHLAMRNNSWRLNPQLSGGGQIYDSGAHLLSSLCWSVESEVAQAFAFIDNHDTPVDINSVITLRFENGVMASLAIGGNCPGNGVHMVYLFEHGRVEIDGWTGKWINVFDAQGRKIDPLVATGIGQTANDNFIDAVLGRAHPRTSATDGVIQSRLIAAIYESARTGRPAKPQKGGAVERADLRHSA